MATKTPIKLDHPIKIQGTDTDTLHFRRPKVGDLKKARAGGKADDFDFAVSLAADLAEVTPNDILELDAADFKKVEDMISGFIKPSKD